MGIYIKGMKMPEDCLKCPFCLFADGYWKCLVDGSHADFGGTCRPSLCPLVSVQPHGRLIDADIAEVIVTDEKDEVGGFLDGILYAADWIANQPTVIEAEGVSE